MFFGQVAKGDLFGVEGIFVKREIVHGGGGESEKGTVILQATKSAENLRSSCWHQPAGGVAVRE
jgi:hypothetical protein